MHVCMLHAYRYMHSLQVYEIAHICHTHAYHVLCNMHEAKRYDMHTTWSCCIHTCTCCTHVICMSTAYVDFVYICIHIHAVHIHMCMHGIACCILQDLHSAQCHKHTMSCIHACACQHAVQSSDSSDGQLDQTAQRSDSSDGQLDQTAQRSDSSDGQLGQKVCLISASLSDL